jgi:uncharacterized membrane protein
MSATTLASVLAIGWEPEIRGISVVLISVLVLCGSVYFVLSTNLGSRLGFLVALAGLFGWLMMMGIFWWVYGIGLQGKAPSWSGMEVIGTSLDESANEVARVDNIADATTEESVDGWIRIAQDNPAFGQTVAAADDILQNQTETFQAGEYAPVAVYEKGGERYPKIGDSIDFLAFFHRPHYAIVEVQPVVLTIPEPGRAPLPTQVDSSKPPTYVLMVRDQGTHRQPAVSLTVGAGLVFLLCCYVLHRREQNLRNNLAEAASGGSGGAVVPVGTPD